MDSLQVGSSLFMRGGAEFADVNLVGAKVGGQLDMTESKLTGTLDMERLQIGTDLFVCDVEAAPGSEAYVGYSEIKGNMLISGSNLPSLDLTGTKIRGEFILSMPTVPSVKWHQDAVLTLRNTEVGTFTDRRDAWPKKLELVGFTYTRLPRDVATRDASWFVNEWLAKQPEYSPQPYQQLASVLRKGGHRRKANDVLYAGRERERKQAKGRQWAWLAALKWFIGYGYRTNYTLWWALALIGIGVFFLWASGQGPADSLLDRIYYTLDTLLPIIELDKERHTSSLTGYVRGYFYFLKIMGYVLASFLAARITGLTEKA